jgi:hypothetical protein
VAESKSSLQAKVAGKGAAFKDRSIALPSSVICAAVAMRLATTQTLEQELLEYALPPAGQVTVVHWLEGTQTS